MFDEVAEDKICLYTFAKTKMVILIIIPLALISILVLDLILFIDCFKPVSEIC